MQQPFQRTSLVDQAYQRIYRRIADGKLAPAAKLVINQLAAEFGTSPIPVREALNRLLTTRLVTFEPNRGYQVSPSPSEDQVQRLFTARLILETGAVEAGVDNVTPEIIEELTAINQQIASGSYGADFEGLKEFTTLNEAFHMRLVRLADNVYINEAYEHLGYHQQTYRYNYRRGVPDRDLIVFEHADVISALQRRSAIDARLALLRHIKGGFKRLVESKQPIVAI